MHKNIQGIAVIGFGYWGPNLVRNFNALDNAKVVLVADLRQERLSVVSKNYPDVQITTNIDDVFKNTAVDAVVIATPVFTHFELAKKALESGKHVLLEKPMTSSSAEAEQLINLAEQKGLTLMVDHTFLYTSAVQTIKKYVEDGTIGNIQYFDSNRINLGLFQPDVNVLWDLAPHDISILNHILSENPYSVQATGISHTKNGIENIAYMTVNYQSDVIAHFHCSWSSPVKIRHTLIGGDKKMIVYNDLEPTEKVRVYDTGYVINSIEDVNRIKVDYRIGDIFIPKLPNTEALYGVASDFVNSFVNKSIPLANANLGYQVVKVLEASQKSIKNNGKEIIL